MESAERISLHHQPCTSRNRRATSLKKSAKAISTCCLNDSALSEKTWRELFLVGEHGEWVDKESIESVTLC
eukprot:scaffold1618_cov196-Alexandrium_tamarense.AAC.8